jgi:O-antigen/teichoic acid export membrane protein
LRPINIEAERWFVSGARLDLSILERAPCRIRVPDSSEMLKSLRPSIIRTLGGDCRLTAVLRGSALVMAIQVLGIALTYSMQVVIARCAGPFEFGVFAYAWTWMNVLFLVAAFGMNESALRLMPSYSARSEWPLLRGFVVCGPAVVFGLAGIAGLAAVGALLLLGHRVGEHYRLPLLLTFAATPLFGLLAFMQGVGRALGSVFAAFLPRFIGLPGFVILAVGGFAIAGKIADAVHIIAATVAAAGVLVLAQATLLLRALPAEAREAAAKTPVRDWLKLAMPFLFIAICFGLLTHCDLLMVGFFLSASDVAIYQAASRTAALVSFPLFALNALVAPMIARLHAENRLRDLERAVSIATRAVFWPSLVAALLAIAGGGYILGIFGPAFEAGHLALSILILGHIVNVGTGPVSYLMTMTGHQEPCAAVWATAVVGQFVLNLLLIPQIGIVGAATGTTLATCFVTISLTILVKRRLDVSAHALVTIRKSFAKARA